MPDSIKQQFVRSNLIVRPAEQGVSAFRAQFRQPLWIVLGVAIGILLIACTNVASILLARSAARSAEMAMRVSLGAARGRLIRQVLTENLLLAAAAGALGWVFARAIAPALVSMFRTADDPVQLVLAMNTRVLLFSAAASLVALVLFGLVPAFQASSTRPMDSIRGIVSHARGLALGRWFVTAQVAFAFTLVMGGAAFLFSLRNLTQVKTGFDTHGVAIVAIATSLGQNQEAKGGPLMDELISRVGGQSGVDSVAGVPYPTFDGGLSEQVLVSGRPAPEREEIYYRVSAEYFKALRTPILSGRAFEVADTHEDAASTAPTPAIVNEALAKKYFPDRNPLGAQFTRPSGKRPFVIVGVAANALYSGLRVGAEPIVYTPFTGDREFTLYVRSSLPLGALAQVIGREAQAVGSGARVREATTLDAMVGNTILREKLLAKVGGAFAFLGLVLAGIGLFGLLNYTVARRTKEIGIRSAVGARPLQLVGLVFRDLAQMAGVGVAVGLAGALGAMRLTESLLFGVKAADVSVMASAVVVFLAAALLAAGLPARRAAGIDPVVALRTE